MYTGHLPYVSCRPHFKAFKVMPVSFLYILDVGIFVQRKSSHERFSWNHAQRDDLAAMQAAGQLQLHSDDCVGKVRFSHLGPLLSGACQQKMQFGGKRLCRYFKFFIFFSDVLDK